MPVKCNRCYEVTEEPQQCIGCDWRPLCKPCLEDHHCDGFTGGTNNRNVGKPDEGEPFKFEPLISGGAYA